MRLFVDANVLFSAARSDGAVRRLLNDLIANGHVLCADGYVAEDARRNLAIKAPHALALLAPLLDQIEVAALQGLAATLDLSELPEKDRPVVSAAVHMRCDALVTGDRAHFGSFYGRTLAGVAIYSPRLIAELLS